MIVEDNVEVVDSTSQSCGGEAVIVGGVGESPKLAWLVPSIEDDSVSLLVEIQRIGDAESGIEEAVDRDDVGIPLNDGGFDVIGGWVFDGVQLALIVLASMERVGCSDRGEQKRDGERLHGSRVVLRVIW